MVACPRRGQLGAGLLVRARVELVVLLVATPLLGAGPEEVPLFSASAAGSLQPPAAMK